MAAKWGTKNKKCHLNGNAEVVPEPPKKVVPVFERGKRSYPKCRATIMFTLFFLC